MGLRDKIRGALEKATEKMDSLAEPGPEPGYQWPSDRPMAVLVESEHHPGMRPGAESGVSLVDMAIDRATGVPYRFVLDVRRPGFQRYQIEQNVRIPSKVQSSLTQGEVHVPRGAEVPLIVTGPDPADLEIDWDGYLALPGRKQQAERLRAEGQWDRIGADFERRTKPAQVQKIRANNRMAVLAWAEAVQRGSLTRATFDQNAEQVLRMGHLLPADYEEARAKLDG